MRSLYTFFALFLFAIPAAAQQDQTTEADESGGGQTAQAEETNYDRFLADYKNEYLALGALMQVVGDFRPEEDAQQGNQFYIANARLRLSGTLNRFGYLLQSNFASRTAILDARISYRLLDDFRFAVGRYKAPFSGEQLIAAANIDFVNRSRVVAALAPGRVVGFGAEASRPDGVLTARAGVFNSYFVQAVDRVGEDRSGDTGRFLYVARVRGQTPPAAEGASTGLRLSIGANALYETGNGGPIPDNQEALPNRILAGADTRLRAGQFLLAGEAIAELVDGDDGFDSGASGYYVTFGVDLAPAHRVLARLDSFQGSKDLLLGYNTSLSAAAAAQVNLGLPFGNDPDVAPGRTRIVVNIQIAL